jgi:hypothetical protein
MSPNRLETRADAAAAPSAQGVALAQPAFGARVANIVMTAQVQVAYAYAMDACTRAHNSTECVERSWPDTPVRELVLNIYRAQEQSAQAVARGVLAGARRRCGLAFAQI